MSEFVSQLVTFIAGGSGTNPGAFITPAPITMRLHSQQVPIRGVSVDAEHTPFVTTVYAGTSAYGIGYSVQGGGARAFGIEDSSAIFVTFALNAGISPTIGQVAYARITVYDFPIISYGIATGAPALASLAETIQDLNRELRGLRHALDRVIRHDLGRELHEPRNALKARQRHPPGTVKRIAAHGPPRS